jgi:putative endonuclease
LYVGCTKNLKVRFEDHNNGRVESTIDRRPLKLIYYESCLNKVDALHRELYLKSAYGKKVYQKSSQILFHGVKILKFASLITKSFMSKLSNYILETKGELKHVSWPTKKQTLMFTALVIIISIGVAISLGLFDYLFTSILKMFI